MSLKILSTSAPSTGARFVEAPAPISRSGNCHEKQNTRSNTRSASFGNLGDFPADGGALGRRVGGGVQNFEAIKLIKFGDM